MLPTVSQWDNYELHFMQDGAPPHFALPVHAKSDNYLPGQWTWQQGQTR